MATLEAQRMSKIVAERAPSIAAAGFRKRRHSFNRPVEDGIVHVVVFRMAPKEPPAWTEVPRLRERLYGTFTVELGVHIPEMMRTHSPRSQWIHDHDCQLRPLVNELLPEAGNLRWNLSDPAASQEAGQVVDRHFLPWLDRFTNRRAVLDAFEQLGALEIGLTPSGALDVADVYRAIGQVHQERRTVERYVAQPVLRSHAPYLAEYLNGTGHGDLVPRIATHD